MPSASQGMLEELGLAREESPEDAPLLVYNTCSVREKADTRLAGHLGKAAQLKKKDPPADRGGWLPGPEQAGGVPQRLSFRRRPRGPAEPARVAQASRAAVAAGPTAGTVGAFQDHTTRWSADLPRTAWPDRRPGCNHGWMHQFCSYCIVPYVRGPEASPGDRHTGRGDELAALGVREVFLGQNVNAYGKEPGFAGRRRLRKS